MDSTATLGDRLRELREARGLRQEDLEERSGVDSQTISNIEVGRQMPRTQTLMKLAKGLGVRPGDLLG
ncbi:MAG: helix-turn-helix domain-containing protein [Actinomycetota bacterium]|nr:helix-turn-helix domain-containing protein [Actinomycetota bacterium]